ncbi:MAG: Smr/MutS family protein [Paracoccaceae bacterium]
MSSRAKGPRLSAADRELFARVVRDVRPLRDKPEPAPPPRRAVPEPPREAASPARTAPPPEPAPPAARRSLRPAGRPQPPVAHRPAAPLLDDLNPAAGLDARTAARLRRGRLQPDARIDLHGMTAERAHAALNVFIAESRRQGLRRVLVITGKGGRRPPEDAPYMPERTGVLRHAVPQWLRTPPLAGLVTGVYAAHRTLGGEGALYVYLRKSR